MWLLTSLEPVPIRRLLVPIAASVDPRGTQGNSDVAKVKHRNGSPLQGSKFTRLTGFFGGHLPWCISRLNRRRDRVRHFINCSSGIHSKRTSKQQYRG